MNVQENKTSRTLNSGKKLPTNQKVILKTKMTLQKMLFDTSNFMTVFPKMSWKKNDIKFVQEKKCENYNKTKKCFVYLSLYILILLTNNFIKELSY